MYGWKWLSSQFSSWNVRISMRQGLLAVVLLLIKFLGLLRIRIYKSRTKKKKKIKDGYLINHFPNLRLHCCFSTFQVPTWKNPKELSATMDFEIMTSEGCHSNQCFFSQHFHNSTVVKILFRCFAHHFCSTLDMWRVNKHKWPWSIICKCYTCAMFTYVNGFLYIYKKNTYINGCKQKIPCENWI